MQEINNVHSSKHDVNYQPQYIRISFFRQNAFYLQALNKMTDCTGFKHISNNQLVVR